MIKGGYKIIDFHDISIDSNVAASVVPVKIPGVYEAIENSYRKPLLLSGFVIENAEKNDQYAVFTVSSTNFVAPVEGGTLTITDEDMVSIVEPDPAPSPEPGE